MGKIFHIPGGNFSFPDGSWEGGWYGYQSREYSMLNSSTAPDDRPEREFRDYIIADEAIKRLKSLREESISSNRPFALSIGFKLPHTMYHIPRRYFNMYRHSSFLQDIILNSSNVANSFPKGAPLTKYIFYFYLDKIISLKSIYIV